MSAIKTILERTTIFIPHSAIIEQEYTFPMIKDDFPWCTQYMGEHTPFIIKSLALSSNLMLFDVDVEDRITKLFWLNSRIIISEYHNKHIEFLNVSGSSLLERTFEFVVPLSFNSKNSLTIKLINNNIFFLSCPRHRQKSIAPQKILDNFYISLELLLVTDSTKDR